MTNQQYEDLTQRKLAYLGRLFESAGAGPAFIRQLEERAYMLPMCVEAVQKLLDEDRYHKPQLITVKVGVGWHELVCDSEDFSLQAHVVDVRFDESYKLALAIIPRENPAESKVAEAIVTQDRWNEVAFGVQFRQHKGNELLVRFRRHEPLYAPQPAQSVQQ